MLHSQLLGAYFRVPTIIRSLALASVPWRSCIKFCLSFSSLAILFSAASLALSNASRCSRIKSTFFSSSITLPCKINCLYDCCSLSSIIFFLAIVARSLAAPNASRCFQIKSSFSLQAYHPYVYVLQGHFSEQEHCNYI
jgi:hypothetical protein